MTCSSAGRHDTYTAYKVDGCRCPLARAAHARRLKRQRNMHLMGRPILVDAEPTRRRLRALARMGWTQREVMSRVTVPGQPHRHITSARVNRALHNAVAQVYAELCMVPGPSKKARTLAANRGWAAPLDWDDIDDLTEEPSSQRRPARRVAA